MELTYTYNIFKVIHIVGIISWMAGILYFYRLFVYHFDFGQKDRAIQNLLSLMEKRLIKYITIPAMTVSVLAGLVMVFLNLDLLNQRWFQLKMFGVLLMISMTLYGFLPMKNFKNHKFSSYTSFGLRVINEIPTLLMILIVALVILRPL